MIKFKRSKSFFLIILVTFYGNFLSAFEDEFFFDEIETNYSLEEKKEDQVYDNNIEKSFSTSGQFSQHFVYGLKNTNDYFLRNQKGIDQIKSVLSLSLEGKPQDKFRYKFSGITELDLGRFVEGKYLFSNIKRKESIRDFYLDFTYDNGVWLRLGNQVIPRGEIDSVIATDIINPRDLSRLGQSELEEIRKHVPAILFSFPYKSSKIEFITSLNAGTNIIAGDYEPFDQNFFLNSSRISYSTISPKKNWEGILRAKFLLNGGNLDFTIGQINWDQFSFVEKPSNYIGEESQVFFGSDRVNVIGFSGNLARSNFLFKYDLAYHDGRTFPKINQNFSPWEKLNLFVSGVGLEYSGFSNFSIVSEINSNNMQGNYEEFFLKRNYVGFMAQARWSFINELLNFTLLYNKSTLENSNIISFETSYDLSDSLDIKSRVIVYNSKEVSDYLYPYRDQDSIKLTFDYSF